ncbi:MAG: translocation/assembly module TamB domain-containing protein, partial [Bacteroidales bacterium]|nr:translocation/assembly module TamB domain-containing protein [Bacteroidales bacterium]
YNTQEFSFGLTLKDTRPLTNLFIPQLYIASGTEVAASYTNLHHYHSSSIESPEIVFNGVKFKNLDIRNDAKYNIYESTVRLKDIVLRDTLTNDPNPISLENVLVKASCANDTLNVNLQWNDIDADDHNMALIESVFTNNAEDGGVLFIKADTILINDSVWRINHDCSIVFKDNRVAINSLMMQTNSQSMAINGYYPKTDADSLNMVFYNLNISNFDFVTKGYDLDLDGVIDGHVCVSGLNDNLIFFSNLEVSNMFINKQEVGEVSLGTSWVDKLKAVYVNSDIFKINENDEKIRSFDLKGYYYTQKKADNLDFDLSFNKFNMATVSPFLSSVVSRMTGSASGDIDIRGSIEEPVITGRMAMTNAGCLINFTNVYYTFNDMVRLTRDKFLFHNVVMRDTLGHEAVVNGYIGHNHLRDFTFDISLKCDDFLALNIPADQAMGFYGTAVTDGTVLIQGPANHISMNINAETKRGTEINVPLTSTSDMDNDFIVFVNRQVEHDTVVDEYVKKITKKDDVFSMNLQTRVTSDADVNIYLPMNMGSISSKGGGNINIGLTPNDFNLRGDYLIESGNFVFTLEMIKRTFSLRRGGTIRWTGDPTDADIDVVGVYRTKTS